MELVLYNTLNKKKEVFHPLEKGKVKIYLCGPTVYDFLHIGNFRGAIFFNLVRNWLEKLGHKVEYAYNYTDIDDKIIRRANEQGVSPQEITHRYITEFEKDFAHLGLKKPNHNPRATQYIQEMIQMIQEMLEQKKAYVVESEVFYSTQTFKEYGKLSGKRGEDLKPGQRVEVDPRKKTPFDFVLWKPAKQGEPAWDSPWGKGRPGWHIECSAMIRSLFGKSIDIHGGGIDLIFPHHENEIAQGEACSHEKYCNYWLHNEFVNLKDEKMSKSLGNTITARAFMEQYHPEILKFLMLSSHYRTLLNINKEKIQGTLSALARIYKALNQAKSLLKLPPPQAEGRPFKELSHVLEKQTIHLKRALCDDFNTGEVMVGIYEVVRIFNTQKILQKKKDPDAFASAKAFQDWVLEWGELMALFQEDPKVFLKNLDDILIKEKGLQRQEIEALVAQRQKARKAKDWTKSDEIRRRLKEMDIEVHDDPMGSSWEVSK